MIMANVSAQDKAKKEMKEPEKAAWQQDAEEALVGIWELSESSQNVIPKFKISLEEEQLQIQFWGRGSTDDEPSEDADDLSVLSRYRGSEIKGESAVAFATHDADYGVMHFTLKLRNEVLTMDGIKIVKDPTEKVNRIITASYMLEGTASEDDPEEAEEKSDAEDEMKQASDEAENDSDKTVAENDSEAVKKPEAEPPVKRGIVGGKIETGSTLRGTITLSPMPAKVTPTSGIEVGGSNPKFSFSSVPEGDYSVVFQGTVNGTTQTLTWKGLEVDTSGGTPKLALSVRAAQ